MNKHPIIEKPLLNKGASFVARTFETPEYELGWHHHIEYELVLITSGEGMLFTGNYVGQYQSGDIYFLGSNLPHTFPKKQNCHFASSVVIQFREDFLGEGFFDVAECKPLKHLLKKAVKGIKVDGETKTLLGELMLALLNVEGLKRIMALFQCLELISNSNYLRELSTQEVGELTDKDNRKIEQVLQYAMHNFTEKINLKDVADLACMSIPAFCIFFKKSTKKTYFDFLASIRISHACDLLVATNKPIVEVCYESGYSSLPNFRKQFFRLKNCTPLHYRKIFGEL